MSQEMSDELYQHCWKRRSSTMHRIQLSVMYHLRRERFLDGLDMLMTTATAASATAAVGAFLKDAQFAQNLLAVVTAVLSLAPIVYSPAKKSRAHGQMAEAFRRLQAECEMAGQHWTEADCNRFAARVLEVEAAGEPCALGGLVADCQNRLASAAGEGPVAAVRPWHRLVMHWIDVHPAPTPEPVATESPAGHPGHAAG